MSPIYRTEAGAALVRKRYLEVLAKWPVPSEHLKIPTREGETFVVASGPPDAPPLLALQGSGGNAAAWQPQIALWAKRFRVYAVDVIGEPGLSAPSRPPLDSEAYALWLDDVLDGLGLEQASFVGVSLGAWMVLDYATRRPQRASRLAVLTPSGIGRQKLGVMLKAALLAPFGAWGRRRTIRLALGSSGFGLPEAMDFLMLVFKHFRPRVVRIPRFSDEALGRLTMPVLAVVGGRDVWVDSFETQRRLEANAPNATVRLLPEAEHHLPDQGAVIADFVRGVDVLEVK